MIKYGLIFFFFFYVAPGSYGQEDTLVEKTLDEVILSVNKWEQELNEVPNKIVKVTKQDVLRNNPQTSADLLAQTGSVFIQKSQLGGGSPMIRGFATNRILLVMDGVRMNNAIYRSGNLQNVISIDPLGIETAEVVFGPGSLIYGSDAIGGVMDFHSLEARFSNDKKLQVKANFLARHSTANREKTGHGDMNLRWQKWSLLSSLSFSSFDDLEMGKHGGQDNYLRTQYIERINGVDSILANPHPRIQRSSGYDQLNLLQKLRYKPGENLNLQYSFIYARTGEAPRYDRLIQYRQGQLRFAEWYYGPMIWRMHNMHVLHSKKNDLYENARFTLSYQDYEESRVDRARNNVTRNRQVETVDAFSVNFDAVKPMGSKELFYGLEYVHNKVGSRGETTDILNGTTLPMASRYPNGSTWNSAGVYASFKANFHPGFTFNSGLRYSYNSLQAKFDTTFIKFPFLKAELNEGALTGNAGLVYRPADTWQVNFNISTGFRMPNIDDIGKLFESAPGNVTVPNPDLSPEYAWNFETGVVKNQPNRHRFEINGFYTLLENAITRRPSTFNGQDSIPFGGQLSRVESLQNVSKATVTGIQVSAEFFFLERFSLVSHANLIHGKETDDEKDEQVPLRHAPPFYGSTLLRYKFKKLFAEAGAVYNSEVSSEDLAPSEKAKTDIYAIDAGGNPYSPGWYTLNVKASWQFNQAISLTAAWENLTNQRYRPYTSGIVAPGSNLIISLRASL